MIHRDSNQRRFFALMLTAVIGLIVAQPSALAQQPFEFVRTTQFTPDPGYAGNADWERVGNEWLVTNNSFESTVHVYDDNFNLLRIIEPDIHIGSDIRGIAYDPNTDRILLCQGGWGGRTVYAMDWNGIVWESFDLTGPYDGFNAMSYDPQNDLIYVLNFFGIIHVLERDGTPVRDIYVDFVNEWSGMEIDWVNNTFLLTKGWCPGCPDPVDQVMEYSMDGNYIATVIDEDCVIYNGFGIYYDTDTGTLFCSNTDEHIWIWERSHNVPMNLEVDPLTAGQSSDMRVVGATPGRKVYFAYSQTGPGSTFVPRLNVTLDIASPALAGRAVANASGLATLTVSVPAGAGGQSVHLQAAEMERKSDVEFRHISH